MQTRLYFLYEFSENTCATRNLKTNCSHKRLWSKVFMSHWCRHGVSFSLTSQAAPETPHCYNSRQKQEQRQTRAPWCSRRENSVEDVSLNQTGQWTEHVCVSDFLCFHTNSGFSWTRLNPRFRSSLFQVLHGSCSLFKKIGKGVSRVRNIYSFM